MKTSLLIAIILSVIQFLEAQTVPNGSFESWTQTGGYSEPTPWNSPNPTTASLSLYTVTRESSVVQSGAYAAKLQTKSFLGLQIPGLLTLGTFDINLVTMEATITGGTPFTWRPDSLTGYIQYEPKFSDECFIGVVFLKQNGSAWDTLGFGNYSTTNTLLSWTRFKINIDYSSTETPTHLNIIILSSDRNNPQPNSALYIDNLEFHYGPTAIANTDQSGSEVLYYGGRLTVHSPAATSGSQSLIVYSLDGRAIFRESFNITGSHYESSPLPEVQSGVYIVVMESGNGVRSVKKIVI